MTHDDGILRKVFHNACKGKVYTKHCHYPSCVMVLSNGADSMKNDDDIFPYISRALSSQHTAISGMCQHACPLDLEHQHFPLGRGDK